MYKIMVLWLLAGTFLQAVERSEGEWGFAIASWIILVLAAPLTMTWVLLAKIFHAVRRGA